MTVMFKLVHVHIRLRGRCSLWACADRDKRTALLCERNDLSFAFQSLLCKIVGAYAIIATAPLDGSLQVYGDEVFLLAPKDKFSFRTDIASTTLWLAFSRCVLQSGAPGVTSVVAHCVLICEVG